METIIARLLDAFERGHMSRRQLVKSLTVATVGAQIAGSPAAAQRPGKRR